MTLPDSPGDVLWVHVNTAGSLASLTAGEINGVVTTQLPAAATTAAACQPRQMHNTPFSSVQYVLGFFSAEYITYNNSILHFFFLFVFFIYLEVNLDGSQSCTVSTSKLPDLQLFQGQQMLLFGDEPEWVCFVIKNATSILEEAEAEAVESKYHCRVHVSKPSATH